ncbi:MAG TPA: DUF808 family protein, partial [Salinarimonas sp.]|nr:DUF808 family protein [Salinarimonas sp.]
PWAITTLLMLGGAFLCYEGAEKVYEALFPHAAHAHEAATSAAPQDPATLENEKVAGAIRTDFILSAEIMAITLSTMPQASLWMQALVLGVVGIALTVLVYGGVAMIVKADDAGVALARNGIGPVTRAIGRGLVVGMPVFLKVLSVVGTAAMIWVGGGILVHGLAGYGFAGLEHALHAAAVSAAHAVPAGRGFVEWLVTAAGSGLVGLVVGAILIPVVGKVIAPLWRRLRGTATAH